MKISILTITMLLFSAMNYGQVSNDIKCIYCNNNELDKLSSAIGSNNSSTGDYSLSAGYLNNASGNYSGAFGKSATASGTSSFAIGENVLASGSSNFALGNGCQSVGIGSFSIGILSSSSEIQSYAFGSYLDNTAQYSILMGKGISPSQKLASDAEQSLAIGFNSNIPTFIVGPSPGINRTGKVGIGNLSNPEVKLHIKADNDEDATIKLQPTGSEFYGKLQFDNDAHVIYGRQGEPLKFRSQDEQNFLFENGNIIQESGRQIITDKISGSLSNKLQLYDNTNGITITNGGKVGIMTGNPQYQLSINGDMFVGDDAWFNGNISLLPTKFIEAKRLQALNTDGLELFNLNGEGVFISDAGNVGINNSSPNSSLDVNGTFVVSDEALFNGNVGIGLSGAPSKELEVNGTIKTTQLQITDGLGNTNDHILMSDQYGNATWTDPASLNDGDWETNASGEIFHNTTFVGIHTNNPVKHLDIKGDIALGLENEKFIIHSRDWEGDKLMIAPQNDGGGWEWNNSIVLFDNGNVGIGTPNIENAVAKLTVKGDILAREVRVRNDAGGADFVFEDDYNLPDLDYVKSFIKENKHLPEIPSAQEMDVIGIEVGELQIKLLQKIEELTLYVIELKEENEEMKGEIEKLSNKIR